jgi:pimeloyl-ACP methyl ester carboxylesterase
MALAFYDPSLADEGLVRAVDRAMARPGTLAAALAATRGQRFAALQQHYRRVKAPALLLWGAEDQTSPPAIGERLQAELPDARLVVFPRCGHFPMLEARAASNAAVLAFLRAEGRR